MTRAAALCPRLITGEASLHSGLQLYLHCSEPKCTADVSVLLYLHCSTILQLVCSSLVGTKTVFLNLYLGSPSYNKLAKLQATLVSNYDLPAH